MTSFKADLKRDGKFRVETNEWGLAPFFTMQGSIPYNKIHINELMRTSFRAPGIYTGTTVVLVDDLNWDPNKNFGKWFRLSPEEPYYARLQAVQADYTNSCGEAQLQRWADDIRRTPIQFEFHQKNSNTAWSRSINLREQLITEAAAVARDTCQRVCEVMSTRIRLSACAGGARVSNDKVSDYYATDIVLNRATEPVNKAFIEACTPVIECMIKVPSNMKVLQACAEKWGRNGPLESVYKLQLITTKAGKDKKVINWILCHILDVCTANQLAPGEVTFRTLKDGIGGNKGFLDLIILKLELRDYLFSETEFRKNIPTKLQGKVEDIFQSHEKYRTLAEPFEPTADFDSTWKADFQGSDTKNFDLAEACVPLMLCFRKTKLLLVFVWLC